MGFDLSTSSLARTISMVSEATLADARTDLYKSFDLLGAGQPPKEDYGQQDYDLMDSIWNGEAQNTGFQLGALFARFVVETMTGFVIGKMPTVIVRERKSGQQNDDFTSQANDFLRREKARITDAYRASLKSGDTYVAYGLDGRLQVISAKQGDAGFELWNDNLNSFTHFVSRVLKDPKTGEKAEALITVIYTNEEIIYNAELEQGAKVSLRKFGKPKMRIPHTLGECPVILIANNKQEDSVFGWSEFAPLIPYMNMWHQVLLQGFAANKYNGNPILAINGIPTSTDQWLQQTVGTKPNAGDTVIERALDTFLRRFKLLALGTGQDAKFVESKNPLGGTVEMLKIILNGMVVVSAIPEFMWGVALEGSNATVREQIINLKSKIDTKRSAFEESLRKLIGWNFVLASANPQDLSKATPTTLPEPKVKINSVDDLAELDIIISWPPQLNSDEQQVTEVVKMLLENQAISFLTAYEILDGYVHDGTKEIKRLEEQFANKNLAINEVKQVAPKGTDTKAATNKKQRVADDKGSAGDNSGGTSTGRK